MDGSILRGVDILKQVLAGETLSDVQELISLLITSATSIRTEALI